jgi:hypothetical protein
MCPHTLLLIGSSLLAGCIGYAPPTYKGDFSEYDTVPWQEHTIPEHEMTIRYPPNARVTRYGKRQKPAGCNNTTACRQCFHKVSGSC